MAVRGRGLFVVAPCRRSLEWCRAVIDVAARNRVTDEPRDKARTLAEATAVRAGGRQMDDPSVLIAAGQLERSCGEGNSRSSKMKWPL